MVAPSTPPSDAGHRDARSLAQNLLPHLREVTDGRLGKVRWFKTDWQRGGAATGRVMWRKEGVEHAAIIKMPVVGRELLWLRRLQQATAPQETNDRSAIIPQLYASGTTLGTYDMAWVVIECFDYGPLGKRWHENHITRLCDAAAAFHEAAAMFEIDQPPRREDWPTLLKDSLELIKINELPHQQRWTKALKKIRRHEDEIITQWRARDTQQWLHGDLHLANAMSRVSPTTGPVSLIDLAEVHTGNWIEDAVYLERQLWARPERLAAASPIKLLAAARRRRGLPVEVEWPHLAAIRRLLMAATSPRFLRSEGHPRFLRASLDQLEGAILTLRL
jgi:hypothetical protein